MNGVVRVRARASSVAWAGVGPTAARRRLGRRYAEATGRVLLVLAPGGYGKSTQVAHWVAADRRPVAWLNLEATDDDPVVLAGALRHALSEVGAPAGAREAVPVGPGGADAARASRVGSLVGGLAPGVVLVLDDVHHLEAEGCLAVLGSLAAHLPTASTLVLAGRALRGAWSTGRLRLRPGVVDVTAADLALDRRESEQLLASLGVGLAPDDLTRVAAQFEGWPAGLRLAGAELCGAEPSGPDEVGAAALVHDYLRAEWTARLAPEHLRFLREAACLERFNGELCDAALGRTASATLLTELRRDEQLLVPLDRRDDWFRLHTLLTRRLATDLEQDDPERWAAIHVAAARWWERAGDVERAVDHAERARDVGLREALVAAHGASYVTRGMSATVRRWCASFPAGHVRSSSALCALRSVDALLRGDGVRALQWCGRLERLVGGRDAGTSGAEPPALWAGALRATLRPARAADLSLPAEHAAAHLDGGPWHALAHLALGGVRFLLGDDRAADSFAAGEFEAELARLPLLQANCIAAGAIVAELDGDRSRAEDGGRRAAAVLVDSQAPQGPTTALLDALHALGAARGGDLDAAAAALSVARQGLTGYDGVAPWYNVLARLPLAHAALLIDDRAAGRRALGELERYLRLEPESNGVRDHLDALHASLDAAGGGHTVRGPSLTGAELKVLRYLPTNLTIADIATRLYVSRNTVKTHVAAIHRKLGTASRRDTVGLARSSGLLDDMAGPGPA